jgi:short-subunit dehydrogenase
LNIPGKIFVVTGGGSGIGRALTIALVKREAKVAAVDIHADSLRETAELTGGLGAAVSTHVLDVSDRKKVVALPAQIIQLHGAVDGLVNNAGIIQPFVKLNDLDYLDIERVLHVNLYSQIYMLKSFLPELLKRPEAYIVNVSSMGGFFPFPGQTLYGASKAAVKLLSEGLYSELLDSNVGVSVVFPGAIDTNISENSGVNLGEADLDASRFPMTSPEVAAETIIAAIENNKFQIYIGRDARIMNLFYRLSPRAATRFMQKQMKSFLPE